VYGFLVVVLAVVVVSRMGGIVFSSSVGNSLVTPPFL